MEYRCKSPSGEDHWESLKIRNQTSPQETACKENQELGNLLAELPSGLIDGVVAGHRPSQVNRWVNGVPVVISPSFLGSFNVMYMIINKKVFFQ